MPQIQGDLVTTIICATVMQKQAHSNVPKGNSRGQQQYRIVLFTGFLDPVRDLCMVPIDDQAEEQRVKEKNGFAGAAIKCIETDYNGVIQLILLTSEQHPAANAYAITNVPALISYLHTCAGFPVIVTWIYVINKGWYSTWSGLTSSQVLKHLEPSEHTSMGRMKMISKGIRSTRTPPTVVEQNEPEIESEPHPTPITAPSNNIHDVYVHWFENPLYDNRNTVGVDLPGRYPDTSYDGHKYIYVMHNLTTNYINAKSLTSRKAPELLRGFEECYNDLKRKCFIPQLVKLDNECSKQMIQMFKD